MEKMSRQIALKSVSVALTLSLLGLAQALKVHGSVYEDVNRNGLRDDGEPAIAGVLVTDGRQVSTTDAEGMYELNLSGEGKFVYITQPSGYKAVGSWFRRVKGTKDDETIQIDFPLVRDEQKLPFLFAHITDVHLPSPAIATTLSRIARQIDEAKLKLSFIAVTGDLVASGDSVPESVAKQWFELYKGAWDGIKLPVYHIIGNHDMVSVNFKGDVNTFSEGYAKGMFETFLNPTYFGFEYAGIHFIALDFHQLKDRSLAIGLGQTEMEWLRHYASHLRAGTKIVFLTHEPLTQLPTAQALWLLTMFMHCRLLAVLSGHEHRNYCINFGAWKQFVGGALSGSWWTGPNPDGYPQGFSIVRVDGDDVNSYYTQALLKLSPIPIDPPVTIAYGDFSLVPTYSGVQRLLVQTTRLHADAKSVLARLGTSGWVELRKLRDEDCASFWGGEIDTTQVSDGMKMLSLKATCEGLEEQANYRVFVYNQKTPYKATEDAELRLELSELDAPVRIFVNEKEVSQIAPEPNKRTIAISLRIPKDMLVWKVIKVRIEPKSIDRTQVDDFVVRSASLNYGGVKLTDERIHGTLVAGDDVAGREKEASLMFELP
jgi:predicted MPP superfamily phosphohydrolase